MNKLQKQELHQWWILMRQLRNGYHLSNEDKRELIRLNHLVMEVTHEIHNNNMLNNL